MVPMEVAVVLITSVVVTLLPAASKAFNEIVFAPANKGTAFTDHAVVPEATPEAPRSLDQLTDATDSLSEAVPAKLIDVTDALCEPVLPLSTVTGVTSESVGGVLSVAVPMNTGTAVLLSLSKPEPLIVATAYWCAPLLTFISFQLAGNGHKLDVLGIAGPGSASSPKAPH